jgi:hypothetical protein
LVIGNAFHALRNMCRWFYFCEVLVFLEGFENPHLADAPAIVEAIARNSSEFGLVRAESDGLLHIEF